jgi:hypothetical protein
MSKFRPNLAIASMLGLAGGNSAFGPSEGSTDPKAEDLDLRDRRRARRAERDARRHGNWHQFRTSQEITGLPPHQFSLERGKRSQRIFARLFERGYEFFKHRADCNRCAARAITICLAEEHQGHTLVSHSIQRRSIVTVARLPTNQHKGIHQMRLTRSIFQITTFVMIATLALASTARGQQPPQKKSIDWSFVKDKRTWIGIGFSTAGMFADQRSSRGAESRGGVETNGFLATSDRRLNIGKHTLLGAALNVAMLPVDLNPDHRFRWLSFAGRLAIGGWWFSRAVHNNGVGR